eukprot:CAMPEP_0170471242 /NCGR_PEP_ID=MMETSP0123-20130129/13507_1 /TAXON_ID=182087 /ORGANISM="Favella ehrenbergii, Strain Fehren 1" /LENGTH=53 /DNA_ID=CAMNT_0010738785 /DNA_START=251 /DNA_END=412 /DNA_ORIENTATION=-
MKTVQQTPQQRMVGDSIKAMGMGMTPDAKHFFGGSFWSQLSSEETSELADFLP